MTLLYIVRHGATDWNASDGRYCGNKEISDIDINPLGLKQAEALSERLKDVPFSAVYSSPLKRAVHTAEVLARPHGLSVNIINELRERNYGEWEGLSVREINERFPGSFERYEDDPASYSPPNGESGFEVGERVLPAVASIAERHPDCSMALVAHEATNRILICQFLELNIADYRRKLVQYNGGLTIVECSQGRWKLLLYNDSSHLAHLK